MNAALRTATAGGFAALLIATTAAGSAGAAPAAPSAGSAAAPSAASAAAPSAASAAAPSAASAAAPSAASASGDKAVSVLKARDTKSRDVITCTITTHKPHYSHHADAENKHRVNVTADIKCTKKVARLSIQVGLYKNGHLYKKSAVKSSTGKGHVGQNAARRCVKKQTYTGLSNGLVTFPPNYTPRTKSVSHQGPGAVIRACKKK